jgi:hypothetical protein
MPSLDDHCAFCGDDRAVGVSIDDGHICLHERILSKWGVGGAHIRVCWECLATDDIVDRIKKALERRDAPIEQLEGGAAAKSEEPRCVLCEREDARGYQIEEEDIVRSVAKVEADCFLCQECIERDDFEDLLRAYFERRGIYVDWLHNGDKPKEKMDCQLPIRMSKATREKLEVAAKAHGVTLNKLVNGLIEGGAKNFAPEAARGLILISKHPFPRLG